MACSGVVEQVAGPGADDDLTVGDDGTGTAIGADGRPCDPQARSFAPARLWQLTDEQYVHVVRDVFGISLTGTDAQIVSAAVADRYTNYSEGITVGLQVAPSYQIAARKVAAQVASDAERLLGSSAPEESAVERFVRDKVARAFRRPLADDEVKALLNMYRDALPDAQMGLQLIMEASLQAPSFLYRTELGAERNEAGARL